MKKSGLIAGIGVLIVGLSVASASAESNNSTRGVTATCYKALIGGIGPPHIEKNMERMEAHHAQNRKLVGNSSRKGIDPLQYVWGAVPFERKEGFNGRYWARAYFMVERIEYFGQAECINGAQYFSSVAQAVDWRMEYVNRRIKDDPASRVSSDWPDHVIKLK